MIEPVRSLGEEPQQVSTQRVSECVDEVLLRPEFPREPGAVAQALTDFWDWFKSLFEGFGVSLPNADVGAAVEWLWGFIIVLVIVFLAYVVYRRIKDVNGRGRLPVKGMSKKVVSRMHDLRLQAESAEAEGDLTLALRLYFFALVIGLGQKGELEYNDAWTNRELLERGQTDPEVARTLKPLVGALNEHSFGERRTEPHEVRRFAELCESMLGGLVT